MAKKKRTKKFLNGEYLSEAMNLFQGKDPLIKEGKLNEANKKYLEEYFDGVKSVMKLLKLAEKRADFPKGYEGIIDSMRYFIFEKRMLPEREAVYDRIKNHVEEGLYRLEVVDNEGKKYPVDDISPETFAMYKKLGFKIEASSDNPENVELFKKMKFLARISADTAYATKMYAPKRDQIIYLTAIGHKIVKNLEKWHGKDSEGFYKGGITVYTHELSHILKYHLSDIWNKKYKNLTGSDLNILFDAEINSDLLRYAPDVAKSLLDYIGVRASTFPKYALPVFVVEAVRATKNNDDFFKKLRDLLDKYVYPIATEEEKEQIEKFIDEQLDTETLDEIRKNIKDKKAQHAGKYIKNKLGKKTIDFVEKRFHGKLVDKDVYDSFERMLKSESFVDLVEFIKTNMEKREMRLKTIPLREEWLEAYNALRELFPKKDGDVSGFEDGDPWESFDESEADEGEMVEMDEDEAIKKESKTNKVINDKIRDKIRNAGFGDSDLEKPLKVNVNEILKSILRRAIAMIAEDRIPHVETTIRPAYKTMQLPAIKGMETTLSKVLGRQVTIPMQKGVLLKEEVPQVNPNVVFAVFDESASISDELLSIFKSTLISACSERDATIIGISMASDPEESHFVGFNPAKPETADKFLRRFKSGGTQYFEKWIYDLDELLENKKLAKGLGEVVKELDLAKTSEEGSKYLLNLWNEGKIRGLVFTDGDLFPYELPSEKLDKYLNYSERSRNSYLTNAYEGGPIVLPNRGVPLVYVSSQKNYTEPWSNVDKNTLNKLRNWLVVSII